MADNTGIPDPHIAMMLDIETLGLEHNCVILSIGVAVGDITAPSLAPFTKEWVLKLEGQTGRTVNLSTVDWWLQGIATGKQKLPMPAARVDIKVALDSLRRMYNDNGCASVWSKGADFDIKIIEHACKTNNLEVPWHYRQDNCFRTLYNLCSGSISTELQKRQEGEDAHSAVGDALYQYRLLTLMWPMIRTAPVEVVT